MAEENHMHALAQSAQVPDLLATTISYSYRTITIECGTLERRDDIYDWLIASAAQPPAAPVETEEWEEVTDGTTKPGDRFSYIPNTETGVGQITSHKRRVQRCSAATEQEISSIVSRLRNFAIWNNRQSHYEPVPLCKEAADLIERIRAVPQRSAGSEGEPFMMLSCREAKQCLHNIPGCICDGDPTNG